MNRSVSRGNGRRGRGPGRPFLYLLLSLPLLLSTGASPRQSTRAPPGAWTEDSVSIAERQARITLAPNGEYRVIEVHVIEPSSAAEGVEPGRALPLIDLPAEAFEVTGLGGDIEPRQVTHSPAGVELVGPLPARTFRLALSYRLPAEVGRIPLRARLPTREIRVLIDRGTIEADPDPELTLVGEEGPLDRPIAVYRARAVASGEEIAVGLSASHIGWRERIAVLAAAALACAVAALAVWRRERLGPAPPGAR